MQGISSATIDQLKRTPSCVSPSRVPAGSLNNYTLSLQVHNDTVQCSSATGASSTITRQYKESRLFLHLASVTSAEALCLRTAITGPPQQQKTCSTSPTSAGEPPCHPTLCFNARQSVKTVVHPTPLHRCCRALLDAASGSRPTQCTYTLQDLLAAASTAHPGAAAGVAVNTAVFTTGIKVLLKGLTPVGVAHAWFLGASIYSAFGAGGYLLVCLYFIFGSLVSGPVLA